MSEKISNAVAAQRLRYPCLVLDHDDTTVDSTAHVHHPAFLDCVRHLRPEVPDMTLEEYFRMNWDPGLGRYYKDVLGFSAEEMAFETKLWLGYVESHVPKAYDGIAELIRAQLDRGGIVCVVSHSRRENILRDYRGNGLPTPTLVYGSELPREQQKPNPWPLLNIMEKLDLGPGQILMVDDLPMGLDMARAAGTAFAAAGWSHQIPEIQAYMRQKDGLCFASPGALAQWLFADRRDDRQGYGAGMGI